MRASRAAAGQSVTSPYTVVQNPPLTPPNEPGARSMPTVRQSGSSMFALWPGDPIQPWSALTAVGLLRSARFSPTRPG